MNTDGEIKVMTTDPVIGILMDFLKMVGEVLAGLKRMELADIDAEILRLRRRRLAEGLDEFKSRLESETRKKNALVKQDTINRGLGNSTVLGSMLGAIDRDAHADAEKATREYNRAIEEISLFEQRVKVQARPWWKKILRCFRR